MTQPQTGRERLLYWIAALGALTLLLELATGVVLWLALPRDGDGDGDGGGFGRRGGDHSFATLDRHSWSDPHNWIGLALVAVVLVHLALNWRWITDQTRRLLSAPP
jgi:Domain of unknown function (DUF4405)